MPKSEANPALAAAEGERVWAMYGFREPGDLVLEDLAFAMGVMVIDGPLETADARLVRKGARGLIRVSTAVEIAGQRRFAIAHEIGHWVLHSDVSQLVACTSEDMLSAYRTSPIEIEANVFAAALLMPREPFARRTRGAPILWSTTRTLSDYFLTSLTSTAVRFVEVSDDYCALVVSEKGRIKWWRSSDAFGSRFRVQTRTSVPEVSVAASLFSGRLQTETPLELPIETWIEDPGGVEGDVIEDSILLARHGLVLSLLSLP